MLLMQSPLLGIGTDMYKEYAGCVAHNSYVHASVELGLIGGTLFIGAVSYALTTIYRMDSGRVRVVDPELRRLRPYLMAVVASYAAGMLSLSECYIVPTYTVLGLATIYTRLAETVPPSSCRPFDGNLVKRMVVVSMAVLITTFVFTQINLRY
jgi:hypothetical protein